MVKGVSRQVIVLHAPEQELFEQAIFILKESADFVSDEDLMREAKRILHTSGKSRHIRGYGPVWACGGAVITALLWLAVSIF